MSVVAARSMLICAVAFSLTGCQPMRAPTSLPSYAGLDDSQLVEILTHRAAMVHTLSAQCDLTLTRQDETGKPQSVRLDGLMLMAPPDHLRLHVWKLNQIIFDLTLRPDGLWVQQSTDSPDHGPQLPPAVGAAQLTHFLSWFEGSFFSDPGLAALPHEISAPSTFRRNLENGAYILCEVDSSTATPIRFRLFDSANQIRFTLGMSDYRDTNGIIWPGRLRATAAATAGNGASVIDIQFTDLDFNSDLTSGAFVPPASAEKQQ